jgi:hypothetical protein
MAAVRQLLFYQRHCGSVGCGAAFWICQCCYRGQRYCSERCRLKARRAQRRAANRRHQQSEDGRLDHRDRQQAYRQRRALAGVTDHRRSTPGVADSLPGPETILEAAVVAAGHRPAGELDAHQAITASERRSRPATIRCLVCGRAGTLIGDAHQEARRFERAKRAC